MRGVVEKLARTILNSVRPWTKRCQCTKILLQYRENSHLQADRKYTCANIRRTDGHISLESDSDRINQYSKHPKSFKMLQLSVHT